MSTTNPVFLLACHSSNPILSLSTKIQKRTIEKLVQAAKARDESRGETDRPSGPSELRREEGQESLRIGLKAKAATFVPGGGNGLMSAGGALLSSSNGSSGAKRPRTSGAFGDGESSASVAGARGTGKGKEKAKKSVMEALMEQEQARKTAREEEETASKKNAVDERKDYWLREGIVVKVVNKKVGGGKYYKKKARLRKVVERYVGEVKMLDSGDRLRVDQEDLETVSG